MLNTDHWAYQYPTLAVSGQLKSQAEDFQVTEILGYEPIGEGEHIYLWVEKTGLNTAYLAEQIAKFCQQPLRNVTYAGRKDKHAYTQQWFSVHVPGKASFAWDLFDEPGAKILKSIRHNKKLRTGVLKGNRFNITLRHLTSNIGIEQRLQQISQTGVPNYYGSQRFGDTRYDPRGGNLVLAEKMVQGETIKNRNKRSMAISALRSWLFNQMLDNRLKQGRLDKPIRGDVMQLAGSNSFFCCDDIDPTTLDRLSEQDIYLSAPLWGEGELASQFDALTLEREVAEQYSTITSTLASLGLKQERRAVQLFPQNMQWSIIDDTLNIAFSLPSGTFATSVLREVLDTYQHRETVQL
ncbi:tRNA pseudouridine(13) synthase TruD [Paraglaciecola aquimarina]|uniref:tRNA pseudouridine synthase D n=1 Tax=Paraglaciecola aquimarina TaxID=1235557 RepID=A0ABU3SV23_9ALTE|nr:tRNA pseudouridine(13) synthase TruD [Paraglaciecola aquimarina]MDU0353856.1 tRNA pseudouridine(13) synthase TruD [Paraglaciecola aquimarina]